MLKYTHFKGLDNLWKQLFLLVPLSAVYVQVNLRRNFIHATYHCQFFIISFVVVTIFFLFYSFLLESEAGLPGNIFCPTKFRSLAKTALWQGPNFDKDSTLVRTTLWQGPHFGKVHILARTAL